MINCRTIAITNKKGSVGEKATTVGLKPLK